jgi:hypothetical protein
VADMIKAVQRTPKGEIALAYISVSSGMMRAISLTEADATSLAAQLLDAVSGKENLGLRAEIAKLRRDQQQILTALQEVARKVARHEQLVVTTSITVEPSATDLEQALSVAAQFDGELRRAIGTIA